MTVNNITDIKKRKVFLKSLGDMYEDTGYDFDAWLQIRFSFGQWFNFSLYLGLICFAVFIVDVLSIIR